MSLPPILPTGAMASGDYVQYMVGYLNSACDSIETQMDTYWGASSIQDWGNLWTRIATDLQVTMNGLSTDVNTLKAQIRMATDAANKL
jgi:hypothetical protein